MLADVPPPSPPGPTGPDDVELFERARGGDREAAAELIRGHYQRVYRLLARMTADPVLAEDLCQETFRKAWRSLEGFRGEAGVATWLHRIAVRVAQDHWRRPRPVAVELEPGHAVAEPGAEAAIDRGRRAEALRQAVLELPDELRETVIARYWGELSAVAIGASLGISEQAVNKRLRKARLHLASVLEEKQ